MFTAEDFLPLHFAHDEAEQAAAIASAKIAPLVAENEHLRTRLDGLNKELELQQAELAQVKAEVDRVWKIHNDFLNVQYFNQGRELIDTRQQLYDAETEITALKAKLEVAVGALEALYNRSNPGATCSIARDALARIEELGRKA